MIFKNTISVPCLSSHALWQQIHCYLHVEILQTETSHQCSPRNGPLLEMSYFTLKYGFTSPTCSDEPTRGCANMWPWQRNCRDSISVTMLRVRSKFFRKQWQNSKHDFHLEGSWPIGVHFRWPCPSDLLCMVDGSSDLCRLCKFLWDSAEHTTLSRNMRPDSGRWFPLVYMDMCVLVHENRKSHFEYPGVGIGQFIAFVIYLYSFYEIIHKCFNFLMLEGVWVIVGTAKIFAKMAAVLLKSSIRHLSMLHRDCYHVIIGIKPCHQKLVLSISPRESVLRGGISAPDLPPQTDSLGLIDNTSFWWQGLIP